MAVRVKLSPILLNLDVGGDWVKLRFDSGLAVVAFMVSLLDRICFGNMSGS